jgi:predicted nucleotidyltransferase component of viral defense system
VERNLLHPFSERCEASVQAVTLEELAAERIAALGFRPRARDVYDLWFILTHGQNILNGAEVRQLTAQIVLEKGIQLNASLDPAYRPLLERGWENSLKKVRPRPSFSQAESEIAARLALILGE